MLTRGEQKEGVMTITFEVPEDVARRLTAQGQDLAQTALEALALEGYRSGKLSQAQVRRLLGYQTRMEVDGFLKEHGIYLEYSLEELEREAEISDQLWQQRQEELAAADRQRRAG